MAKKEKTELEIFKEWVKWFDEIIWGTPVKSECKANICCEGDCHTDIKPKRARTKKGKFKAEDKSTKDVNEAWVGGKAPKKKRKK